jgi:hypothetical protein
VQVAPTIWSAKASLGIVARHYPSPPLPRWLTSTLPCAGPGAQAPAEMLPSQCDDFADALNKRMAER